MGSPPRLKKKYEVPRKAWEKERIEGERELVKKYGIKRKTELRRMEDVLRSMKRRARALIGKPSPKEEKALTEKARELGLVKEKATIDAILSLTIESVLERRLQSRVLAAGLANTLQQARQFIVHGHITVAGQKITSPAYIVRADEEGQISFSQKSQMTKKYEIMKRKPVAKVEKLEKAEKVENVEVIPLKETEVPAAVAPVETAVEKVGEKVSEDVSEEASE